MMVLNLGRVTNVETINIESGNVCGFVDIT